MANYGSERAALYLLPQPQELMNESSWRFEFSRTTFRGGTMHLILIRRDDPEQTVTLVRWQNWPQGRGGFAGWWGQTATMIAIHRTPCMFPDGVWQLQQEARE
jgi:hypothetical protein